MGALDDVQKSLENAQQTFPFPDACELVKEPDPELLGGGTLRVKQQQKDENGATCEKWTEFEEGGISSLTVRVSALASMGAQRGGYENVLKRVEEKECERLPGVEEIACVSLEDAVNRLDVGRGPYQAVVIFRFSRASKKENRRYAEEAAGRISRALV